MALSANAALADCCSGADIAAAAWTVPDDCIVAGAVGEVAFASAGDRVTAAARLSWIQPPPPGPDTALKDIFTFPSEKSSISPHSISKRHAKPRTLIQWEIGEAELGTNCRAAHPTVQHPPNRTEP